ncbi:CCR4-NOT transcription complex subunit 10-B [Galdieria sulphuraria]|nr:CCR4-NOT transcription complex subunit 10-B [Galdieria sulphuraria]
MLQVSDDTETQHIADESFEAYRNSELDKAIDIVRKLESSDPIRTKLNYSVCLYYKELCKDPFVVLNTVAALNGKKEMTDMSLRSTELSPWFSENPPFELAYAVFNEAVISYQLHFWKRSCELLETLYSHIGAFDDALVFRVWLLLFDVYMRLGCSDKAAIVFGFLERTFPSISDPEDGKDDNLEVDGSPNLIVKSLFSAYPSFLVNRDKEDLQLLLSYYRARLYLNLRSYKLFKKEIKSLISSCEASEKSLVPPLLLKVRYEMQRGNPRKALKLASSIPDNDLEYFPSMKCILLNNIGCIHIKLGRQNLAISYLSLAEKQLDSTVYEDNKDKKEIRFLVLGEYEHAAHAFWKCAETFMTNARLWVRLAECCVGFDAQMECEKESKQVNDLVEQVVGKGSRRRIVIHSPCTRNKEVVDEDYKNGSQRPLLSLQYGAECARTALYLLNKKQARPNVTTSTLSVGEQHESPAEHGISSSNTATIASGRSKQTLVTFENDVEEHSIEQGIESSRRSNDNGSERLIDWQIEKDNTKAMHETNSSTTETTSQPTASKVISGTCSNHDDEDLLIRESALALLCYCCLSTCPEEALRTAKELMQMSHVSPEILFLAHLYGVEALCALGRPDEALEMLSPQILEIIEKCSNLNSALGEVNIHSWSHSGTEMSTGTNSASASSWNSNSDAIRPNVESNPSSFTDSSSNHIFHGVSLPNYPSSISRGGIISRGAIGITGTAAFYVNLSSVCVLKNKLGEAAAAITRALSLMPRSSAALLMSTYIKIREGDLEGAKDILKCHRVTSGFQSLQA